MVKNSYGVSLSKYKPKNSNGVRGQRNMTGSGSSSGGMSSGKPKKWNTDYDSKTVDVEQKKEVEIWINLDADVYRQRLTPTTKHLANKMAQGTYIPELAEKQYFNVVTDWSREHRADVGEVDKPTRMAIARNMRRTFEQEYKYGNYDNQLTRVSKLAKERREHPTLPNSDVKQIVKDHEKSDKTQQKKKLNLRQKYFRGISKAGRKASELAGAGKIWDVGEKIPGSSPYIYKRLGD